MAFGVIANGGLALGWEAASGTLAVARNLAHGEIAYAPHANDTAATIMLHGPYFKAFTVIIPKVLLAGAFVALLTLPTFMLGHFVAFTVTKEERELSGRKVTREEIFHHALGLPTIVGMLIAGTTISGFGPTLDPAGDPVSVGNGRGDTGNRVVIF